MKSLDEVMIESEEDEFGVVTAPGEAYWCGEEIEARVINSLQGGRVVKRRVFYGEIEEVPTSDFNVEIQYILSEGRGDGTDTAGGDVHRG